MNLKVQLSYAFIISLFSAISFSLIALLISDQHIAQFDNVIIAYVQGFESPVLTMIMNFFTSIGSGMSVVVLSVLVLYFLYRVLKHRSELLLFIAVVAGSAVLNGVLKSLFHRARPHIHRIIEASGYSFPSGHSMSAFALYGILSFLLWRHISGRFGRGILIIVSILMIIAIGTSRIYLGVHYPSDVLGGYLASGFWLAISVWFYQRYKEKRYEQKYSDSKYQRKKCR